MQASRRKPHCKITGKELLIVLVAVLLAINGYVLVLAQPETLRLDGGGSLAKDFSAYYIGSWRLWHNPADLYTYGSVADGEPIISPHPQLYKYLPSFLVLISPFQLFTITTVWFYSIFSNFCFCR